MDKIVQLSQRLDRNLSDYNTYLLSLSRQAIIDMATHISAMADAHYYLTDHHDFDDAQVDYLLKFDCPLEIVADKWLERLDDISDMSFAIDEVFDKRDALKKYALVAEKNDAVRHEKTSIKTRLTEAAKDVKAQESIPHEQSVKPEKEAR